MMKGIRTQTFCILSTNCALVGLLGAPYLVLLRRQTPCGHRGQDKDRLVETPRGSLDSREEALLVGVSAGQQGQGEAGQQGRVRWGRRDRVSRDKRRPAEVTMRALEQGIWVILGFPEVQASRFASISLVSPG
jgi:hypothetical protein